MKKKIFIFILSIVLLFGVTGCKKKTDPVKETLNTPTNITMNESGLVTWDEVLNADSYVVCINDEMFLSKNTSYQVQDLTKNYNISIIAKGSNFNDSAESNVYEYIYTEPEPDPIVLGISGSSEVKSKGNIQLDYSISGYVSDSSVTWSITKGNEYCSINEYGKLTANEVSGDKVIVVRATSNENSEYYAEKTITIVSKPILTQEMLDSVKVDKVSYQGYLNISLYTMGLFPKLYNTYKSEVKTAMDGECWYAEYENSSTGTVASLYYRCHDSYACQVSVSLMNDEEYEILLDDNENKVSWVDAGLYNSFKSLSVSDFTFDEETWRYKYTGSDESIMSKMVASANPYDFDCLSFSLLIEDDEILGFYAISDYDYTLADGYKAIQELFVAIDTSEEVECPTITKFEHVEEHNALAEALVNMHNLTSYTVDYRAITATYYSSSYTEEGFKEYITETDCVFDPYTVSYNKSYEEVINFTDNDTYGFHKVSDNLYNSYYLDSVYDELGVLTGYKNVASRAYNSSFDSCKPTFGFAPEIFTQIYKNTDDGSYTYYVNDVMSFVATTFYYGVGNDINLYGIFATTGYTSSTDSFTPYVTVKDGYITEACFYFYLGSIYGVIELTYSDFNSTVIPSEFSTELETRNVPTTWNEVTIEVSTDESGTSDDIEMNAYTYLHSYFKEIEVKRLNKMSQSEFEITYSSELLSMYGDVTYTSEMIEGLIDYLGNVFAVNKLSIMPFLGNCLGDTYGFGLTTYKKYDDGSDLTRKSIVFYYDVPLDLDYTIDSSLEAIENYLIELGFVKENDYMSKDGIHIMAVDSSLDLLVYFWYAE